jgi:DNA primase
MVDVLSVLHELNIPYKERHRYYSIPCPNQHEHPGGVDENPSCNIDKEKGIFHCFTCHYSGHISKLYLDITGNKLDIDPIYYREKKPKSEDRGRIQLLKGYEKSVYSNSEVMSFLQSIGVYKKQFIDKYQLKYVIYAEYGQIDDLKPIKFINRIVFPVIKEGNLINVEGRTFTGDKIKTIYPRNAISDYVYNIENIDPTKPIVVVEGIKDLCKVWNITHNVVSIFGGHFTEVKYQYLLELGKLDLILFIDHDKAGFNMARKVDELWPFDFKICIPDEENQDPNNLTLQQIAHKIEHAVPYERNLHNKYNYKTPKIWEHS